MRHATEPATETSPSAWAGTPEQSHNRRGWLDEACVSTWDLQFRTDQPRVLEKKHQVAPCPMSAVPPPGPRHSASDPAPHAGLVGTRRPDAPASSSSDLVPYHADRGDRGIFSDTAGWAGLAASERPPRAMPACLPDSPGELETLVDRQVSREWSGKARLSRPDRADAGNRPGVSKSRSQPDRGLSRPR